MIQGLLILVVFIVWAWYGTKLQTLKNASNTALDACEDEIIRLRRAIIIQGAQGVWQDDFYEKGRRRVVQALEGYNSQIGFRGDPRGLDAVIPSFQRSNDAGHSKPD